MKRARISGPSRRGDGFTLVELLIALTLISMLMTVLFGSLGLASRAWQAAAEADDRTDRRFTVHDWLRRELELAQPVLVQNDSSGSVLAFSGRARSLRFVAPLPAHLGGGGFSRIDLLVEDTADGSRLLMTAGRFEPSAVSAAPTHQRILAEDLRSASFSYFGTDEDGGEPRWRDEWVGMTELPLLVRLSAQPIGDRRVWPPLIVRLMIDEARR
jgi:general secretion pathway protein J